MASFFDFDDFSLKNLVTMPSDIALSDAEFIGDLFKDPSSAFGDKQKRMTGILDGVGFNDENKINQNSDAVMGTIFAGVLAAGAMGGGAAAGAGGGASGGTTGGTVTGAGMGAGGGGAAAAGGGGAGAGGTSAAASGSWLSNPYVQTGMGLLQQRQQQQQATMNSVGNQQLPQASAGRYAQQQDQQGYNPYGRGGLLG